MILFDEKYVGFPFFLKLTWDIFPAFLIIFTCLLTAKIVIILVNLYNSLMHIIR